MQGLTALIVSSVNGIGLNIVQKFVKNGYNVVLNGDQNDINSIKTIENQYQQKKMICSSTNLQNHIDIHKFINEILCCFENIHVLIINHEFRRHYRASIEEFPLEKWKDIIDNNLISTFALIKTLWPYMKRQHFGRIINITNEHSLNTNEYRSACTTSHHALLGLTRALSVEGGAYGITSNIICPGTKQDNIVNQYNQIKTLDDLILFLCSNQARSINGQLITWDWNRYQTD